MNPSIVQDYDSSFCYEHALLNGSPLYLNEHLCNLFQFDIMTGCGKFSESLLYEGLRINT